MTTIAFAGLGSMGLPMARNLLQRGFTVRGFDVNARASRPWPDTAASPSPRPPPPRRTRRCCC